MNSFKLTAIGNLAKNPELVAKGDVSYTRLCVIGNDFTGKDEDGNSREVVTSVWFVAFGGLGEAIANDARKGDQLILDARIRSNNWIDPQGEKQYDYSFVVEGFRFGHRVEPSARSSNCGICVATEKPRAARCRALAELSRCSHRARVTHNRASAAIRRLKGPKCCSPFLTGCCEPSAIAVAGAPAAASRPPPAGGAGGAGAGNAGADVTGSCFGADIAIPDWSDSSAEQHSGLADPYRRDSHYGARGNGDGKSTCLGLVPWGDPWNRDRLRCTADRELGALDVRGIATVSGRNAGLTAEPLFVGATRPPMRWGVTYSALLCNLVFSMEAFL